MKILILGWAKRPRTTQWDMREIGDFEPSKMKWPYLNLKSGWFSVSAISRLVNDTIQSDLS